MGTVQLLRNKQVFELLVFFLNILFVTYKPLENTPLCYDSPVRLHEIRVRHLWHVKGSPVLVF